MKVATWNVNSVKARHDRVMAWLDNHAPDVLCLQEIKVPDDKFPTLEVESRGYTAAVFGQKAYNGVALLSREAPTDVERGLDDGEDDDQARLISGRLGELRVVCVYVPNGQAVGTDKYEYKLRWMERLLAYLRRTASPEEPLLLCGDFNVAPRAVDVNRVEAWADSTLCHETSRQALAAIMEWGLVDVLAEKVPEGGVYSWWDYRMLGFPKNNGLRIDLVLATKGLAERCLEAGVDRPERKGKLPSDHAPVVTVFEHPAAGF